ncbi:MAG: helix-turn-helix domain-containing protein [Syntrophomonadaceae bacterium]|nr:helix-turn-helix domain-containing protein [Syntrophomonadaceae bacterium]
MAGRTDKTEILEKALVLISKGYSQNAAAKELGVPQGTINAWIRRAQIPLKKNKRTPPPVNRAFNQPNIKPDSKPPKTVTIGNCVNCGRPIVVAKWVAEYATWPIEHCSRECRNGTVDVEEAEAI